MSAVPSLLESLARSLSCGFLSDLLHIPAPSRRFWLALRQLSPDAYPDCEWQDALLYLTGQALPQGSAEDCRRALLDYYQSPKQVPISPP